MISKIYASAALTLTLVTSLVNAQTIVRLPEDYAAYFDSEYSKKKVVVEWNSKDGQAMFQQAQKDEFYQLAPYYQPQHNPVYCGMASLVVVANYFRMSTKPALASDPKLEARVNQPEDKVVVFPFQGYSQLNFFSYPGIAAVKSEERVRGLNKEPIFDPGVNLDEFAAMAKAFELNAEPVYAATSLSESDTGYQKFITDLKDALSDPKKVLVANFRGKMFGAPTGGHISPIVALYTNPDDPEDMRVLILDVAAHKNPWTWIPTKDFYYAMNSHDKTPARDQFRGYIVFSDARAK